MVPRWGFNVRFLDRKMDVVSTDTTRAPQCTVAEDWLRRREWPEKRDDHDRSTESCKQHPSSDFYGSDICRWMEDMAAPRPSRHRTEDAAPEPKPAISQLLDDHSQVQAQIDEGSCACDTAHRATQNAVCHKSVDRLSDSSGQSPNRKPELELTESSRQINYGKDCRRYRFHVEIIRSSQPCIGWMHEPGKQTRTRPILAFEGTQRHVRCSGAKFPDVHA
jgi:hypothetical protein